VHSARWASLHVTHTWSDTLTTSMHHHPVLPTHCTGAATFKQSGSSISSSSMLASNSIVKSIFTDSAGYDDYMESDAVLHEDAMLSVDSTSSSAQETTTSDVPLLGHSTDIHGRSLISTATASAASQAVGSSSASASAQATDTSGPSGKSSIAGIAGVPATGFAGVSGTSDPSVLARIFSIIDSSMYTSFTAASSSAPPFQSGFEYLHTMAAADRPNIPNTPRADPPTPKPPVYGGRK
jgi:hypothetical protein